jgi:hypothetical protein
MDGTIDNVAFGIPPLFNFLAAVEQDIRRNP